MAEYKVLYDQTSPYHSGLVANIPFTNKDESTYKRCLADLERFIQLRIYYHMACLSIQDFVGFTSENEMDFPRVVLLTYNFINAFFTYREFLHKEIHRIGAGEIREKYYNDTDEIYWYCSNLRNFMIHYGLCKFRYSPEFKSVLLDIEDLEEPLKKDKKLKPEEKNQFKKFSSEFSEACTTPGAIDLKYIAKCLSIRLSGIQKEIEAATYEKISGSLKWLIDKSQKAKDIYCPTYVVKDGKVIIVLTGTIDYFVKQLRAYNLYDNGYNEKIANFLIENGYLQLPEDTLNISDLLIKK